jgi:hypothetical protein
MEEWEWVDVIIALFCICLFIAILKFFVSQIYRMLYATYALGKIHVKTLVQGNNIALTTINTSTKH